MSKNLDIDFIPNDFLNEGSIWFLTFYQWDDTCYREPREHTYLLVTKPTSKQIRKLRRKFRQEK